MTVEDTKEAIRIMQAWVDGKEIICENNPSELDDGSDPFWNWEGWVESYRIKTKTVKYVKKASEIIIILERDGYEPTKNGAWRCLNPIDPYTIPYVWYPHMWQYCNNPLQAYMKNNANFYKHWLEEREIENDSRPTP